MSKAITRIKKLSKESKGEREMKITTGVARDGGPVDMVLEKELPVDLVFELCLRLPIHKVFQFMCVSNQWRLIISHPDFFKVYYSRNHSRILFLSLSVFVNQYSCERRFYYSLLGEQWVRSPLKIPDIRHCPDFTQVINGLVCAYSCWSLPYLCNIFTGEVMALPDSGDTHDPSVSFTNYYFAFDPVNRSYKLLRLVTYDSKILSCKILTLGSDCNSSWRKLVVPESIAVAGYIYGRTSIVIHGVLFFHSLLGINAFNFTEENFYSVLNPIHDDGGLDLLYYLAQSRGRLALVGNLRFRRVIIYMLNDNGSYSWTSRKIILPRELQVLVVPVGSLPTGEILLAPSSILMRVRDSEEARDTIEMLYSYDYEKNKLEKFEIGKLPQLINLRDSESVISCVEQKVGSLNALIHGDGCFR